MVKLIKAEFEKIIMDCLILFEHPISAIAGIMTTVVFAYICCRLSVHFLKKPTTQKDENRESVVWSLFIGGIFLLLSSPCNIIGIFLIAISILLWKFWLKKSFLK